MIRSDRFYVLEEDPNKRRRTAKTQKLSEKGGYLSSLFLHLESHGMQDFRSSRQTSRIDHLHSLFETSSNGYYPHHTNFSSATISILNPTFKRLQCGQAIPISAFVPVPYFSSPRSRPVRSSEPEPPTVGELFSVLHIRFRISQTRSKSRCCQSDKDRAADCVSSAHGWERVYTEDTVISEIPDLWTRVV